MRPSDYFSTCGEIPALIKSLSDRTYLQHCLNRLNQK